MKYLSNLAKVFEFQRNEIRTIIKDSEPWFVAKDVCNILGLDNVTMALKKLDEDEKGVNIIETLGGKQEVNTVNESGLYNLIFRSNKEEAKQFKRWVTHEVLPSIRKTGSYSLPIEQSLEIARIISTASPRNMPLILKTLKMSGIELKDSFEQKQESIKVSELRDCSNVTEVISEFIKLYKPLKEDKNFYFVGAGEFREYCRENQFSSSEIWKDAESIGLMIPRNERQKGHSLWLAKEGTSKKVYLIMKRMLNTLES